MYFSNYLVDGGGYGLFGAVYDPSPLMNTNGNGFITVEIQYRLGAFGFLSSAEVRERGTNNAGLLDQRFALQWVQQHITKFGGNPRRVTIGGESAGAGASMLHALAYGGEESNLFQNVLTGIYFHPLNHDLNPLLTPAAFRSLQLVRTRYRYTHMMTLYPPATTKNSSKRQAVAHLRSQKSGTTAALIA